MSCFKCQEKGHKSVECPSKKSLTTNQFKQMKEEVETVVFKEEGENLFRTRFKVGGKKCNVIIISGSCVNVASTEMITKLNLPTRDHAKPYKLSWLDDFNDLIVKKQALVNFSIGTYNDELWCDVIPMSTCHLLLGRPWQFDRQVTHNRVTCRSNCHGLPKSK